MRKNKNIITVSANRYSKYVLSPEGLTFRLNHSKYVTAGYDRFSQSMFCYKLNKNGEPKTDNRILIQSRDLPATTENYRNFG